MSESNLYRNEGEDAEMEAASVKARDTFGFFWRELAWEKRRIIPGLGIAALKVAFSDPPEMRSSDPNALETEHMWLGDVDFDGKEVTGTLMNEPHSLQSVSEGDTVTFGQDRINDWMYAVHDRVYGGFTVNLIRSRMSKGERKQHDGAWGLEFGDPENVLVVPPVYLGEEEEAEESSGGFFSSLFGKKKQQPVAKAQDYSVAAEFEHPMSVNMRGSLEEALKGDPSMLESTDDNGFAFLHQLSLAGSFDGVDVVLNHNADPNKPANNGMTPLQLAKTFNWKKVISRLETAGAQ